MRRALDWFLTDRTEGGWTVAQAPNALALVATGASVLRLLPGRPGRVAALASEVALAAWAVDEVARGVNPWRRSLGAANLVLQAWRLAR